MATTIYSKQYKEIAEKLEKTRKEADLTQKQVAQYLKKPQSYISKVEAGQQRIDIIELSDFAKLYKKSINFFIK
ncbi:MAG: helix-turn-helix transcriptional regulator [Patescibacteria group bacterium]